MSRPNGITDQEYKELLRNRYINSSKRTALAYLEKGLCRACGGSKENQDIQHCNKCRRRVRSSGLKRLYGISIDEYEQLSERQGHVCWICKGKVTSKNGNLLVDHSHKTGKIRGLLCTKCNAGIGGLGDSIEMLERAIDYLKHFKD